MLDDQSAYNNNSVGILFMFSANHTIKEKEQII